LISSALGRLHQLTTQLTESMAQTPEEIPTGAWQRVHGVQPPIANPAGTRMAFRSRRARALGTAGLLDDATIRHCETHARGKAERLGASLQPPAVPADLQP
jgi:hypothetical protein